tara:strand:- start:229 stop:585 length:357 start_codon:yes stop_codon:yes gene_type:complete
MKLTTQRLKQLIKEELAQVVSEMDSSLEDQGSQHSDIVNLMSPQHKAALEDGTLNYNAFQDVVNLIKQQGGASGIMSLQVVQQELDKGIGSDERHNEGARQIYRVLQMPENSAALKSI